MYELKELTEISEEALDRIYEATDKTYYPSLDFKAKIRAAIESETDFAIGTFHGDLLVEAGAYRNPSNEDYVILDAQLRGFDKFGSRSFAFSVDNSRRRCELVRDLSGKHWQLMITHVQSSAIKKHEWRKQHPAFNTVDWQEGSLWHQLVGFNYDN
jgi:hypothetical protein